MTEPGGRQVGRRWTGRCYAHLILPVAYLTDSAVALFDEAVGAADGWRPVDEDGSGPRLRRGWRRPDTGTPPDELRLTVLGWYPLLVTLGTGLSRRPPRASRAGQRALRRAVTAALTVDGRWVPDRELPHRLASARDRVGEAGALHARAERQRDLMERRCCSVCRFRTADLATHCDRCGRRFTAIDDAERDERRRRAEDELSRCAASLEELARDRPLRVGAAAPTAESAPVGEPPEGA